MIITYITAVGVLIALIALGLSFTKLNAIHVLVNSRLTSVITRVGQLITVLKEHGIDVPDDPDEKDHNVGLYLLAMVPNHWQFVCPRT
jgi:uncharacterized protein YabE (DUF348 family)